MPDFPHQPEAPRHGGREKDQGSRRDGLLPAIGEQGAPLVMAHHQDMKLRSVAADKVVLPYRREAGQEDARLPKQGQPFASQHPLFAGRGDFQTLADKWHSTSTG